MTHETKHTGATPGPWQTGTYQRGRFCVYAPKSNGRGICVMSNTQPVRPEEVAKYGEHGLNLEADANARLISAAPELLEALVSLRKELHSAMKFDVKKHYSLMVADVVADKAIAKAEGRTP